MAIVANAADGEFWQVASYMRLSREDGADGESDSIGSQRLLIEDWAARRGNVQIVAHYVDDGYSGATFDRPGFQQMIADAARGMFDTIVVKDLSRFGRSYLDCGSWIERDLPRMGVRLFSITDDFDSMQRWDYNLALLVPIKNLINEMQVITTSQKVRASLSAKRARGECVANFAPYGYEKDPCDRHRLVVDEPAAQVVRNIYMWRLAGMSASAIARTLNLTGVDSPLQRKRRVASTYRTAFCSGTRWHAKTVLRILRDETYTGTLVQGRTRYPSWRMHVPVAVPPGEWARTPLAHEAIVDPGQFEAVGRLLDGCGAAGAGGRDWGRGGASGGERCGGGDGEGGGATGAPPEGANGAASEGGGATGASPEGTDGAASEVSLLRGTDAEPSTVSREIALPALSDNPMSSDSTVLLLVQLRCSECGAPMRRLAVSRNGRRYLYWVCSAHRRNVRCCSPHSVREEELAKQLEYLRRKVGEEAIRQSTISITNDGRLIVE